MILNLHIENAKQMFALMFYYCCNNERLQVLSCCPNVCNNKFLLCFPPKRAHNFIRNILNAFLSILWTILSFVIFHEIRIKLKCFLYYFYILLHSHAYMDDDIVATTTIQTSQVKHGSSYISSELNNLVTILVVMFEMNRNHYLFAMSIII